MTPDAMRARTKLFALDMIRFVRSLPNDEVSKVLGRQLVRSATSVGANYRAACLAKSPADMTAKLKTVEEEVDESAYWLELIEESGVANSENVAPLKREAIELTRIIVASIKTLKSRK